jgi:hypothetical protein
MAAFNRFYSAPEQHFTGVSLIFRLWISGFPPAALNKKSFFLEGAYPGNYSLKKRGNGAFFP